jgi:hypothetical protein|tara:strand:- start:279 stop:674 length:396 start_codon:yes stop_codon:yes gene_type:complete
MSLIRNKKQIKQGIDFSGIKNGAIHPSDIDAVLEFNNEALILIEVKRKGNTLPTGQRLLLERISDSWHTKKVVSLFLTHENYDPNELIELHKCKLDKYYWNGKWLTPQTEKDLVTILNELGVKWNIKKLKV